MTPDPGSPISATAMMETEVLPPLHLKKYHVVLGRHNDIAMAKALTPAVKIYNRVRDQMDTGAKHNQPPFLHQMKHRIELLLQKELGYLEPPTVTFWVDVRKATKGGQLERFLQVNPQLRKWTDLEGNEVVFVQDHQDFFLKADLADHEKRRASANIGRRTTLEVVTRSKSLTSALAGISLGQNAVAVVGGSNKMVTSTACTLSTWSTSETASVGSSHQTDALFQLMPGPGLEEEIDRICFNWIVQGGDSNLDVLKRKANLVETLKSYIAYYKKLLKLYDPCRDSPIIALQQLNGYVLVQVINTLGNSMNEWYQRYPFACLPGEAYAWNETLLSEEPSVTHWHDGQFQSDFGVWGIETNGAVATYDLTQEEEEGLPGLSPSLSEFYTISRGDPPLEDVQMTRWTIPDNVSQLNDFCFGKYNAFDGNPDQSSSPSSNAQFSQYHVSSESTSNYAPRREWSPYIHDQHDKRRDMDHSDDPTPSERYHHHSSSLLDVREGYNYQPRPDVRRERLASAKRRSHRWTTRRYVKV